jgi:hypothetical protein
MLLDVSDLRFRRQGRGWDVPEMARQMRRAAGGAPVPSHDALVRMIRRWEAGSNGMSERYRLLCARALEGHGASADPGTPQTAGVWEEDEREGQVQRREFLAASAAVAGYLTVPPQLARLSAGRRVGGDLPDVLSRRLARLRRLDNYLGGAETYHVYAAEAEATKTLLREAACGHGTRRQLTALFSEQAQQAGWAAFDAGWQATARALYNESLAAAQDCGNRALEGNAFALLAYQNLTTGAAAAGLADASCAAAGTRTPSAVRALLHERRAWAIAQSAGPEAEVRRALDRAAAALQEPCGEPAPDWAAWVDQAEIQIMTGRCLVRTGQPLQAIAVLSEALGRFDETQARDMALYTTWLAEAYLDAGDVDAAAATAGQILALSSDVASVRPGERLSGILRRLSRYSDTPPVADLIARARHVTSRPASG